MILPKWLIEKWVRTVIENNREVFDKLAKK